jgi:hypothetical protein
MADLTQSYGTTSTTTPQFYTDYLNNVAGRATAGANAAQYVGASPLQTQAFTGVAQNVGNYQPALTAAGTNYGAAANTNIAGAATPYLQAGTTTSGLTQANPYLLAGSSSSAPLIDSYMNPYTSNVVDQIRLANQQNIAQNLSPAITSGAVGSGQFGSARGANALALGISNANIGALTEQTKALQSGYAQALQAAEQQRLNQLNAGQTAGTLQNQFNTNQVAAAQAAANAASQQASAYNTAATGQTNLGQQVQQSGLADVNALATLGGQQQTIAQNQQLFPLDVAAKQMAAMSGAQIPTTTMQTMTGSPLSAIAGLGALAGGLFSKNASGTSAAGNIYGAVAPVLSDIYSGVKTGAQDVYNKLTTGSTNNPSGGGGSGPITGTPYDDNGNLNPGYEIVGSNPVYTGNTSGIQGTYTPDYSNYNENYFAPSDAAAPDYWDQFNQ